MINRKKRYDLDLYERGQRQQSGKEKILVSRLQKVFVVLSSCAAVLGLILMGAFIGRLGYRGSPDGVGTVTAASGYMSASDTAVSDTSETEFTIVESLPVSEIADNYWGPLEECKFPVPYDHVPVHGLYLNAAVNLEQNLDLIDNSCLDAVVIDLKEGDGVYFGTTNELALSVGPYYARNCYDLTAVCNECHARGVRVIGRIVAFKDPQFAAAYPDRAICDSTGEPLTYYNEGGESFINPYDSRNWDYLIDLAVEAIGMGVDEIQFDYVRFPTGNSVSGAAAYYGPENEVPDRSEAINRFLQTARIRIQDTMGVPVSGDIFGIAVTSSLDGDLLGQDWATVGFTGVDSLCPMIYPSHYALGTYLNGTRFPTPDTEPYAVMYNALTVGSRYHSEEGYSTVRPYLQAFTASYIGEGNYMVYDYDAINAQIRGLQDAGLDEFILWNAACTYPDGNYSGNNG